MTRYVFSLAAPGQSPASYLWENCSFDGEADCGRFVGHIIRVDEWGGFTAEQLTLRLSSGNYGASVHDTREDALIRAMDFAP